MAPREHPGGPFWHILAPRDHPAGPCEQQGGHEGVWNRIFVDFGLIWGPYRLSLKAKAKAELRLRLRLRLRLEG